MWSDYLVDGQHSVTFRFPPTAAESGRWPVSTDNDSTFVPGTLEFLRKLTEHDQFVARTTPYNESPVTAVFDSSQATPAIAQVAETCGWILGRAEAEVAQRIRDAEEAEALTARIDGYADTRFSSFDLHGTRPINVSEDVSRWQTEAWGTLPHGLNYAYFDSPADAVQEAANSREAVTIYCARAESLNGRVALVDCRIEE